MVLPTPPLPRKKVSLGELEVFFGTQTRDEANTKVTKANEKVTELVKTVILVP